LVVPGLNQAPDDLRSLTHTLRDLGSDIPWHLNGFVPRYRLADRAPANLPFLVSAAGSAYAAGMQFVYVGNVPGFSELSHTRCPGCHAIVVRRENYTCLELRLVEGRCPECQYTLPGLWSATPKLASS
jgi:pyruvate formate lyase activating enzyme